METVRCLMFRYGWEEEPGFNQIDEYLAKVFDGKNRPCLIEPPSSKGGDTKLIVSSMQLTPIQAEELWKRHYESHNWWEPADLPLP